MTAESPPWAINPSLANLEHLPPLLKIQQAADAVGLSYSTIRRQISRQNLKAYRVGPREIRVDRDSLIAMVRSNAVVA